MKHSTLCTLGFLLALVSSFIFPEISYAAQSQITDVALQPLPDNRVRMALKFNQNLATKPRTFTMQNPARIVIDLPNVGARLSQAALRKHVELGALENYDIIQAGSRTRVVLYLTDMVKHQVELNQRTLYVHLAGVHKANQKKHHKRFSAGIAQYAKHRITGIDFRGTGKQAGKLVVDVSDPNIAIDIEQRGNHILIDFKNTQLLSELRRRLDVLDFSTPVKFIDATQKGQRTQIKVSNQAEYEYLAYQVDKKFIVDVFPMSLEAKARKRDAQKVYSGKRISLNFQDIKVRAVLQLLAEFTGSNIVVSDTVNGSITLRLNDIPWDQALAIILKTRGLDKRHMGAVMLIAPQQEIAMQERRELEAQKEVQELAPLHAELVQINYAKAVDVSKLLKAKGNSLLSSRGNVSVDERTNTLWVQDTAKQIDVIRRLIRQLDIPVKQVLIEARVVIVNKSFTRDIGVRFGVSSPNHLSGTLVGANDLAQNIPASEVPFTDRLNFNLPALPTAGSAASIGLALAKLGGDVLLDLELSALETEGLGEVISSPRLITANQQAALIESGEEIPYQEATSSGATAVAFKKAVLSLKVVPQITPDKKIILSLQVNQDVPGEVLFNGVPPIETKEIQTNVLIDNGQTIVLGGIYKQDKIKDIKRIPFLGSLPVLGHLFRNKRDVIKHEELLIFITPKIIDSTNDTV